MRLRRVLLHPENPVAAIPVSATPAPEEPALGSTDPIKPNAVKTFTVHPGTMHTASLSPLPSDSRKLVPAPATANPSSVTNITTVKSETPQLPPPGAKPGILGVLPANKIASAERCSVPVGTAALIESPPLSRTAPVAG